VTDDDAVADALCLTGADLPSDVRRAARKGLPPRRELTRERGGEPRVDGH